MVYCIFLLYSCLWFCAYVPYILIDHVFYAMCLYYWSWFMFIWFYPMFCVWFWLSRVYAAKILMLDVLCNLCVYMLVFIGSQVRIWLISRWLIIVVILYDCWMFDQVALILIMSSFTWSHYSCFLYVSIQMQGLISLVQVFLVRQDEDSRSYNSFRLGVSELPKGEIVESCSVG